WRVCMRGRGFGGVGARLIRLTLTALILAAGGRAVAAEPSPAAAPPDQGMQVEVGAFAGAHLFAGNVELGVRDMADAPHPKTGVLFGLRGALIFLPWVSVEAE